jgi:hypothetical protein
VQYESQIKYHLMRKLHRSSNWHVT